MKRFLSAVVALLCLPAAVYALNQSSVPPKFGIPWGNNAGAAYIRSIPTPSQIGSQNCAASLTDGFPPLTFVPAAGGGCPPFGQDFNGILKQLSQWNQWQSAGGPVFYDSGFATAASGYPKGAILSSAVTPGDMWMSTADGNLTNPDDPLTSVNWVQAPGQVPIGTPMQSLVSTVPTGYVAANALTIGDASSNATGRANADTLFLYVFLWGGCNNTACPILTSAGTPSTRGATASADFAAHKALSTPNMKGMGLMGVDTMGGSSSSFLTGVPVTSGNATTPGSVLGENLHALTSGENGPHTHAITDPGHSHTPLNGGNFATDTSLADIGGLAQVVPLGRSARTTTDTTGITINSSGSGTGHNTVERSMAVYWNLKL